MSEALLDYLQDILEFSRLSGDFINGLSPRAGLAALHCAKAWALMQGRAQVLPEDIQAIIAGVAGHRLIPVNDIGTVTSTDVASHLISQVPIP